MNKQVRVKQLNIVVQVFSCDKQVPGFIEISGDLPDQKDGFVRVLQNDKTVKLMADNRGTIVYSTETLIESKVDYLGEIKNGFTKTKPEKSHKWSKDKWVTDEEAIIKEAEANISVTIYNSYTEAKQSQDSKWWLTYTTKFKGWGCDDIERLVYLAGVDYFKGEELDAIVEKFEQSLTKEVTDNIKLYEEHADVSRMFKKLVKISLKTEWADRSIIILINNIENNTESPLPNFPSFDQLKTVKETETDTRPDFRLMAVPIRFRNK